jgi:hypothetical protein
MLRRKKGVMSGKTGTRGKGVVRRLARRGAMGKAPRTGARRMKLLRRTRKSSGY